MVTVVHRLGLRCRVRVADMYRNRELARRIEALLGQHPGVEKASASPLTATVLVLVESERVLDEIVADLTVAVGSPVVDVASPPRKRPRPPELELLALVARAARAWRGSLRGEAARPLVTEAASNGEVWHSWPVERVLEHWQASASGLASEEVELRLTRFGANALSPPERRSELAILLGQFTSAPVAMLGAAAVLSLATASYADAAAIAAVVALNAGIGYVTESRTERTIALLEPSVLPSARVRRAGVAVEIDAAKLVPGDVVLLAPGTVVMADARLLEANELFVDESTLTGESLPVAKRADLLQDTRLPIADRMNMVFRGTRVTGGNAEALVVETGPRTEIGRIQSLVGTVKRPDTPLERQLRRLGGELAIVSVTLCGAVFVVGALRGQGFMQMLKTSVSLAVAAVPEGLPTVAVTTLALGIRRMRAMNVLVRHLDAVETLGAVQVFCLDKTGTITQNRMAAAAAFTSERRFEIESDVAKRDGVRVDVHDDADLRALLTAAVLCNEAEPTEDGAPQGSPTEAALLRFAVSAGVPVREVRAENPICDTRYRSQARSYMSTDHRTSSGVRRVVKGRPTEVLALCSFQYRDGVESRLDDAMRASIETENERMAGEALRVLGFAWSDGHGAGEELVWLGLVGLTDPPRPEVKALLPEFHRAGIDTVMITGDQSATAHAVSRKIGLGRDGRLDLLDSTRLDELPPDVLRALIGNVQVFARVNPAQKLQIVRALQEVGRVVAMTGDGVNDSPALKAADVGVAMGGAGSSAARETAAVILEDDRLSSMLIAVEQGRTIYDDIKKAVHFILATNSSEILFTFTQVAAGLGDTLTPMQLLWINILTDVFPELALAVEPPEAGVLERPPRDPKRPMFETRDLLRIGREGVVLTAGALAAYGWGRARYGAGPHANTLAFTALTSAQLLHAISARSEYHSIFDREHLPKNVWIPLTLGGSLGAQILVELIPGARKILGTTRVSALDWMVAAGVALGTLLVNEGIKVATRPPSLPVQKRLPERS